MPRWDPAKSAERAANRDARFEKSNFGAFPITKNTKFLRPGAIVRFTYRHHTGLKKDEVADDSKEVLILHPNHSGTLHAIDLKRLTQAERDVLMAIFDENWVSKVRWQMSDDEADAVKKLYGDAMVAKINDMLLNHDKAGLSFLEKNWADVEERLKNFTQKERLSMTTLRTRIRTGTTKHRLPLVNDILKRMDPLEEVRFPQQFYTKFVKVFLGIGRGIGNFKDAYRTYFPSRMQGVTLMKSSDVGGGMNASKPLFVRFSAQTLVGKQKRNVFSPSMSKTSAEQQRVELIKKRHEAMKQKIMRPKGP